MTDRTAPSPNSSARPPRWRYPSAQPARSAMGRSCACAWWWTAGSSTTRSSGFTHEPGYEYVLRIEEYDAYPGQAVIPQDTPGRSGYRLIEEVSKVRYLEK